MGFQLFTMVFLSEKHGTIDCIFMTKTLNQKALIKMSNLGKKLTGTVGI